MKNGGSDERGWCKRVVQEDRSKESAKVGWTCGTNGRGSVDEVRGSA